MISVKTKRLQKVYFYFKNQGENQASFAVRLGLTQAHFSRLLRGLSPFLPQHGLLLEYVYGVNIEWIEKGRGQMLHELSLEKPDRKLRLIVGNYQAMDETGKESLLSYSYELNKMFKKEPAKVADKSRKYKKIK
ncbi:MAG: hypothetical protein ABUK01_05680 [Leptospirales bacterium]